MIKAYDLHKVEWKIPHGLWKITLPCKSSREESTHSSPWYIRHIRQPITPNSPFTHQPQTASFAL